MGSIYIYSAGLLSFILSLQIRLGYIDAIHNSFFSIFNVVRDVLYATQRFMVGFRAGLRNSSKKPIVVSGGGYNVKIIICIGIIKTINKADIPPILHNLCQLKSGLSLNSVFSITNQLSEYVLAKGSFLLGKTVRYLLAKICSLFSGSVISTSVSFFFLQRIIPIVLFSVSSFTYLS